MTPSIRPATLADASALAVLVDIAGEGMPNWLWRTLAGPGASALAVGRDRARRDEGGFSYRHATIAELGDEIAASLIGYPLDDPYDLTGVDALPAYVQPLVRLEGASAGLLVCERARHLSGVPRARDRRQASRQSPTAKGARREPPP